MNEHDVVIINESFNGIKFIPKGTKGTILFVSESSKYVTVEFFDENHNTISVETLLKTFVQ